LAYAIEAAPRQGDLKVPQAGFKGAASAFAGFGVSPKKLLFLLLLAACGGE